MSDASRSPAEGRRGLADGGQRPGARRARCLALAALRIALGALFVFSGSTKLRDPELFGFALKALRLPAGDRLLVATAFAVPWWEVVAGAFLLFGLWVRAAAALVFVLLFVFTASIVMLMVRGLAVDCPCFGAFQLMCSGPLGVCHLVRNCLLLVVAAMVIVGTFPRQRPPEVLS